MRFDSSDTLSGMGLDDTFDDDSHGHSHSHSHSHSGGGGGGGGGGAGGSGSGSGAGSGAGSGSGVGGAGSGAGAGGGRGSGSVAGDNDDDDDNNGSSGGGGGRARFLSTDSITTRARSETSASDYNTSEKLSNAGSEADRVFLTGPLQGVGLDGKDSFTPQQREILFTMWQALRGGVEILKHGLTGKPRPRFLYCDASLRALFWREKGGRPDAELDAEFDRTSATAGTGAVSAHSSWLGRHDADRFLVFRDILEVRCRACACACACALFLSLSIAPLA